MAPDSANNSTARQSISTTRRLLLQGSTLLAVGTLFAKGASAMIIPFYQNISSYGVRVYANGGSAEERKVAETGMADLLAGLMKEKSSRAPVDILASNDERLVEQNRLVLVGDMSITQSGEVLGDGEGWIIAIDLRPFRGGKPGEMLTTGGPVIFNADNIGEFGSSVHIRDSIAQRVYRVTGLR